MEENPFGDQQNISQTDIHIDHHDLPPIPSNESLQVEDVFCKQCQQLIEEGNVISFGDHVWHFDCFVCQKCQQPVQTDSNIMLSSTGYPVCEGCSYSCQICKQPILEEAIMTDQAAYHEQCFKCTSCQKVMSDLLFSQTEEGLVCLKCLKEQNGAPVPPQRTQSSREQARKKEQSDRKEEPIKTNSIIESVSDNQEEQKVEQEVELIQTEQEQEEEANEMDQSDLSELELLKLKLQESENTLEKFKLASKNALEEFHQTKSQLTQELLLKQKAERAIFLLKTELDQQKEKILQLISENETLKQSEQPKLDQQPQQKGNDLDKQKKIKDEETKLAGLEMKKETLEREIEYLMNEKFRVQLEVEDLHGQEEKAKLDLTALMKEIKHRREPKAEENESAKNPVIRNLEEAPTFESVEDFPHEEVQYAKTQESAPLPPLPTPDVTSFARESAPLPPLPISETREYEAELVEPKDNIKQGKLAVRLDADQLKRISQGLPLETKSIKVFKWINQKNDKKKKPHQFHLQPFLVPAKCYYCNEMIWQVKAKEMQCKMCGISCHAKCSQFILGGCQEKQIRADIFGHDLSQQAQKEGRSVPLVVEKLIMAVEQRAMDQEGIYRKSGLQSQVRDLIQSFNLSKKFGEDVDLLNEDLFGDVHVLSTGLKQYFRMLPVSLIVPEKFNIFVNAYLQEDIERKFCQMASAISQLPDFHYETLGYLIDHLHKLTNYSQQNLMTSRNLSVVFGPNLMKSQQQNQMGSQMSLSVESMELAEMAYKNGITEFMISFYEPLFTAAENKRFMKDFVITCPKEVLELQKAMPPVSPTHHQSTMKLNSPATDQSTRNTPVELGSNEQMDQQQQHRGLTSAASFEF